jgi:hypothetical protein
MPLNSQTNCDHVYIHFNHSFLDLMLMLFIGWNLFALFSLGENLTEDYEGVKITYGFISELLKRLKSELEHVINNEKDSVTFYFFPQCFL